MSTPIKSRLAEIKADVDTVRSDCVLPAAVEYLDWLVTQLEAALAREEALVGALEDANEFTTTHLEDMEHYFDDKCIPTAHEVNQCAMADSAIRLALGKWRKERDE